MARFETTYDPALGPTIRAGIGYPKALQDPTAAPQIVNVTMLIDTGATITSISRTIADGAGLRPMGLRKITSASHETEVHEYLADLYLPTFRPPYHHRNLTVIEFIGGGVIQGLLGRDVLERGTFELNGPDRRFALTFD